MIRTRKVEGAMTQLALTVDRQLAIAGIVVTVVGVILGILFGIWGAWYYFKKAQKVAATVLVDRNRRDGPGASTTVPNLRASYGTSPVIDLSVSEIIFWNEGSMPIKGADVIEGNPYRVVAQPGIRIVDAEMLGPNSDAVGLSITAAPDESSAVINFTLLRPGGGGMFQVVHTGTGNEALTMDGATTETADLVRVQVETFLEIGRPVTDLLFASVGGGIGLISIVIAIALMVFPGNSSHDIDLAIVTLILFSLILFAIFALVIRYLRASSPLSRLGRVLQTFTSNPVKRTATESNRTKAVVQQDLDLANARRRNLNSRAAPGGMPAPTSPDIIRLEQQIRKLKDEAKTAPDDPTP